MRIGEPARKHGVPDTDIAHALRNPLRRVDKGDDVTVVIGPAANGTLLEVGVLNIDGDDPVVIHAMPLRRALLRWLTQGGS